MIKDLFRRSGQPLTELVLQTTRELGKCYSRLELASSKLEKRNKDLFDACSYHMKKGSKARATIYAKEIAEIRKILAMVRHSQLSVERAILRLDTLRVISPTVDSIKGVFGDVKNAIGLVSGVMPSITPEMSRLNTAINEILVGTQLNLDISTPAVVGEPVAQAILQEAADIVEEDLQKRIPEPPVETRIPKPAQPIRPLIALAADGSEAYLGEDGSLLRLDKPKIVSDGPSILLKEELVMDYIERHQGEMNLTKCAKELNLPPAKVLEALDALGRKGKIRIEP
ncbi:MAG: hypothetical protein ACXADO_11860 [Candidatus Thorarchaeota archaeon]|jgi:division protein CdvB (Snf7/Vps24/ESCRT-III family)